MLDIISENAIDIKEIAAAVKNGQMKALLITHKLCNDGAMCAGIADILFDSNVTIEYIGYNEPDNVVNNIIRLIDKHDTIIIADIAISSVPGILEHIKNAPDKYVYVYDHHIVDDVVAEKLSSLAASDENKVTAIIDESRSGSMIMWDAVKNAVMLPLEKEAILLQMLKYVDDRDRWINQYKETGVFFTGFIYTSNNYATDAENEVKNYKTVARWLLDSPSRIEELMVAGRVIHVYQNQTIEVILSSTSPVRIDVCGTPVLLYCAVQPSLVSDLCNKKLHKSPKGTVVGAFVIDGGNVRLSFRSINGEALTVARHFGGGGHANAAGATTTLAAFMEMLPK